MPIFGIDHAVRKDQMVYGTPVTTMIANAIKENMARLQTQVKVEIKKAILSPEKENNDMRAKPKKPTMRELKEAKRQRKLNPPKKAEPIIRYPGSLKRHAMKYEKLGDVQKRIAEQHKVPTDARFSTLITKIGIIVTIFLKNGCSVSGWALISPTDAQLDSVPESLYLEARKTAFGRACASYAGIMRPY